MQAFIAADVPLTILRLLEKLQLIFYMHVCKGGVCVVFLLFIEFVNSSNVQSIRLYLLRTKKKYSGFKLSISFS